jgi:hypothetical protein
MDCCHSPDYVPVVTSQVMSTLKRWLNSLRSCVRLPPLPRRQLIRRLSPEKLDAWETRPLLTMEIGRTQQLEGSGEGGTAEPAMQETISTGH